VEIIPIDSQRATTAEAIEAAVKRTGLPYRIFDGTLEEGERYLVFGSFYVVEAFLKAFSLWGSEE
jgi:folylpolyglutamate synthase/dihydropteroate synthase